MRLHELCVRIRAWLRRPVRQRAKAVGLALLGVCAASAQGQEAREQAKGITISLGADDIQGSYADETAALSGNVRLRAEGLPGPVHEVEMEGDRITVALQPGDVAAPGMATLRAPGLEVHGKDVLYNLRSHDFHAEDARAAIVLPLQDHEVTVFADSKTIDSANGETELRQARVTTCEREHPHYAVTVRRAQVLPARDRVALYGGTVELYGVRLLFVPKLNESLGLRKTQEPFELALPGYSSVDGFYYPVKRRLTPPEQPFEAKLNLRLTQNSLLAGRVLTDYTQGGLHVWGSVIRHDQRQDDLTQRLLYDALPEFGVEFTRETGAWTVHGQLSGGYYREKNLARNERAAGTGATLSLGWDWKHPLRGRDAAVSAGVGARGSLYGDGDSYRTVDLHVVGSRPLWSGADGRLGLRHYFIGGHTPFQFDDVDLRTEL